MITSFLEWWHRWRYSKAQAKQSWMVLLLMKPYWFPWMRGMISFCSWLARSLVINFIELLSKEMGLKSETAGTLNPRNQGDERWVNTLETNIVILKGPTKIIQIRFDVIPTFLDEFITKAIRSRSFVIGKLFNHFVNFSTCELLFQRVKIVMSLNKRG